MQQTHTNLQKVMLTSVLVHIKKQSKLDGCKWMNPVEKENMEPLGLEFIKLGLQDVLYDPKTKVVYTPNTNQSNKLEEVRKKGKN